MKWLITIHTLAGPFCTTREGDNPLDDVKGMLLRKEPVILDDGGMFQPWNSDHIVGLTQEPVTESAAPEDPLADPAQNKFELQPGRVHSFAEAITYLGKQTKVTVLMAAIPGGCTYFMLYKVDGQPAAEAISERNHQAVVEAWLNQTVSEGFKGQYEVVKPHGIIDRLDEAASYLLDYVKDTTPEKKPEKKTGKAYTGWNDDRGQG